MNRGNSKCNTLSGVGEYIYSICTKHTILNISVWKTKLYPVSNSLKISRHLWSCLLSHHVLPADPIFKFLDCTLLPLASFLMLLCDLSQHGQQDVAPYSTMLLHHTTLHQSPCFLSITVPPCHLREWFNHLWPSPSFNEAWTLRGPPAPYKRLFSRFVFFIWCNHTKTDLAGYMCVCVTNQDASTMCVIIPCSFSPCSFSSETLTSFWFVYESMLGEFGGGEPCARKNIWHCWDTDTCCWTSEPSFKIIRN